MKPYANLVLVCFVFVLFAGAAGSREQEKEEIDKFLTAWHLAAATADEDTYFDSIAPGGMFIGTDAGERWDKEAFLKFALPYFQERDSAWIFRAEQRHIYLSADSRFAWFDEVLFSKSYWTSRGSGVLEKIGGRWQIRQYVLSLTIPNEAVREVKPVVLKYLAGQGADAGAPLARAREQAPRE